MMRVLCMFLFAAASANGLAESRKYMEAARVQSVKGSVLSTEEREILTGMLQKLNLKCIAAIEVVVLEEVVHQRAQGGGTQSTAAVKSFLVKQGVLASSIYEDQVAIAQVRERRASDMSSVPAVIGDVEVEMVCTPKG